MIFLRLLLTFFLLGAVAPAQETAPAVEVQRLWEKIRETVAPNLGFTTIAEVNRVFTTPGSVERAVKIRGTVIQSVPADHYAYIQDGRQGILLVLAKTMPVPALGESIEVDAMVKFVAITGDTTVWPTAIRVTGKPGVPTPLKLKLPDIRAGKANRQAVEAEGVVVSAFKRRAISGRGGFY